MKIKSKLLIALLLVSLVPATICCVFSYLSARSLLTRSVGNHLRSVASLQHARVNDLVARNLERLALVASRTQLRLSLARLENGGGADERERVNRILTDARHSIDDFTAITVYGLDGVAVAATDPAEIGRAHFDMKLFRRCQKEYEADYLFLDGDGRLMLCLSGPLTLDDKLLGVLVVRCQTNHLLALVADYSGLGQTGETLLVKRDARGDAILLTPTRFDRHAALRRTLTREKNYVCISSVSGTAVSADGIDYREKPVLAIVEGLAATGWGMVVKIDKAEAYAPVDRLRDILLAMAVVSVLAVVTVATIVVRGVCSPIDHLAGVAGRVAAGNLELRAEVTSRDEVGMLAATFNDMLARLHAGSQALEEKIGQLNDEIGAHERVEKEKEELIGELRQALAEIKTLKGIMPICAACKKIRDDQGIWNQIESYIRAHSEAEFSHGLCPECARKLYPDIEFPMDLR